GMVLLGVWGFVGVGAYSLVIFSTCLNWPLWLSLILSGVIGVVIGLIVAPSIFRMRGVYFSMSTLVIAEALYAWFSSWSYTGGGAGIIINAHVSTTTIYYLALLLAVASIIVVKLVMRSTLGLKLKAIGNDEDAARTVGINTYACKLYCFLIASFMCGIAGAVYFLYPVFVTPGAAFSSVWLINTLTAASIGGWTSIEGVIFGVVFVVALQQFFYIRYPGLSMLINGIIIVVIFVISPKGVWPAIRDIINKRFKKG
ncbi:MAG: branched-chain amino acid ABC transporter permease, partial [Candidatus Bathyarchaeia archaeon]